MTATRDRRRESDVIGLDVTEWGQRSTFGTLKGWPWWATLLLALGLSIVGAVIDMNSSGNLGKIFEATYFIGCVGAVLMVRRRNLFGPTVQAPLILAVTIPVVVLLTKGLPAGSSTMSKLLALGVPLVTGFPTMAITTGATVVIGGIRWLAQRKPVGADADEDAEWVGLDEEPKRRSSARDGERGSTSRKPRTSGSGRAGQDRASREDSSAPRERTRAQSSARGRGDAADRPGRATSSKPVAGKAAGAKAAGAKPTGGKATGAKPATGKSGSSRSSQDRGSSSRGGSSRGSQSSRDREQPGRPSRDEGRRQSPRRRDDDDY